MMVYATDSAIKPMQSKIQKLLTKREKEGKPQI